MGAPLPSMNILKLLYWIHQTQPLQSLHFFKSYLNSMQLLSTEKTELLANRRNNEQIAFIEFASLFLPTFIPNPLQDPGVNVLQNLSSSKRFSFSDYPNNVPLGNSEAPWNFHRELGQSQFFSDPIQAQHHPEGSGFKQTVF